MYYVFDKRIVILDFIVVILEGDIMCCVNENVRVHKRY
jgi:hypothetical protein